MTGQSPLRYAKLGYVALNVTDIARSRHFYETLLGLEVTEIGPDGEVFLRCSDDHHNVILYPSAKAGLRRLGWEMESEAQLDHVRDLADACGFPVEQVADQECHGLTQGQTLRFTEPLTGARMEYYNHQRDFSGQPYLPTVAKIQRLGHVVLRTPHYNEAVAFYRDRLNFPVSDTIDGRTTFMRCFPNPFHHSFGLGAGAGRALHHVNFMVSEIDDIGRALWRMQQHDVPIVYGPGRHTPSDSVFLYFTDPDGVTCEYSFGMEEFPEVGARKPRRLAPVPSSADVWGCPPPRFSLLEIEEDGLEPVPETAIH